MAVALISLHSQAVNPDSGFTNSGSLLIGRGIINDNVRWVARFQLPEDVDLSVPFEKVELIGRGTAHSGSGSYYGLVQALNHASQSLPGDGPGLLAATGWEPYKTLGSLDAWPPADHTLTDGGSAFTIDLTASANAARAAGQLSGGYLAFLGSPDPEQYFPFNTFIDIAGSGQANELQLQLTYEPLIDLIIFYLESAEITADGEKVILTFADEVAVVSPLLTILPTLKIGEETLTLEYLEGNGTDQITYTLSRTVLAGEEVTLDYTTPGQGEPQLKLQDEVNSFLASEIDFPVANGSTATPPLSLAWAEPLDGNGDPAEALYLPLGSHMTWPLIRDAADLSDELHYVMKVYRDADNTLLATYSTLEEERVPFGIGEQSVAVRVDGLEVGRLRFEVEATGYTLAVLLVDVDEGGGDPDPDPDPELSLTFSPDTLTLAAGDSATVTLSRNAEAGSDPVTITIQATQDGTPVGSPLVVELAAEQLSDDVAIPGEPVGIVLYTATATDYTPATLTVTVEEEDDQPVDPGLPAAIDGTIKFMMPLSVDVASHLAGRYRTATHSVTTHVYTGSPEGVIAASPGSLSIDPLGGELYIKRSGDSSTGWQTLGGGEAPELVDVIDTRKDTEATGYYYYGVHRSDDSWSVYRYAHGTLDRSVSHGEGDFADAWSVRTSLPYT